MESKRRPGFSRNANPEDDPGHSLMHKSDSPGANQAVFNWGPVTDKRTDAPPEVMNTRKLAPMKGTKNKPVVNPFASRANPFANLNSNNLSQSGQLFGQTQSQSTTGPAISSMGQPSSNGDVVNMPNNSIFQSQPGQDTSGGPFSSFTFGQSSGTPSPTLGNASNPFQFGASKQLGSSQQQSTEQSQFVFGQPKPSTPPLFSFGQETSSTQPLFTFGQPSAAKPTFSFGQSKGAEQESASEQGTTSQTSNFSFGQQQNNAQGAPSFGGQNAAPQNAFSFLSQQPAKVPETTQDVATQKSNIFGVNQSGSSSLFAQPGRSNEPAKSGFGSATPINPTQQSQKEGLDGLASTSQTSNLFAQSQAQSNNQTNNNIFGLNQESSAKHNFNPFGQSTIAPPAQAQQSIGSLFNQPAKKSETSPNSQNAGDADMTTSPTKLSGRTDDYDTVMTSPSKQSIPSIINEAAPKTSEAPKASPSIPESSQHPALEAPKFQPLSFESGPFKNPFAFPSMSSGTSSADTSSAMASKSSASINPDTFKVAPFTPPFSLNTDNSITSQSTKTSTSERSNVPEINGPITPSTSAQLPAALNQPHHGTADPVYSTAVELKMLNRAFLKAFSARDPLHDHSDMMRAYILQVEKITKALRGTKRKALDEFNTTVKKAKPNDGLNGSVLETPGKSKTSNLFASIVSKTGTPSGASADHAPTSKASLSDINHTEPSIAIEDLTNEQTPAITHFSTPSASKSLFGNSSSTKLSAPTPTQSNSSAEASTPYLNLNPQEVDSAEPTDKETSGQSTGRSLFDRIEFTKTPATSFENPFANLGNDTAVDQTWKADSPIKFGTSHTSPGSSSFLFPGQNHASPGTSRATTPGTGDGGITSEAESTTSHAGEDSESENPPQAQLDLTTEDAKQEILFETEKAKALIKNTSTKSWDVRGIGPIRILKHSDTGSITVLMRLSPSGKVLLHTSLVKELSYTAQGTGAVLPVASEGGKLDTWFIKFKTRDLAEAFADKCEELKNA